MIVWCAWRLRDGITQGSRTRTSETLPLAYGFRCFPSRLSDARRP
jgi:hypothetical protein